MTENKRVERLIKFFEEKNIEAMIVTSGRNCTYLSGFRGTSGFLVITRKKRFLFTDFRYIEQAESQAEGFEVIAIKDEKVSAILKKVLDDERIKRVGFEEEHVNYGRYVEMREKLYDTDLIPLKDVIENLRAVKDADEIEKIKQAVSIADRAFEHVAGMIVPGMKEREIAAEIEYFMKKNGAGGSSFETIVASGVRSSLPHGTSTGKIIKSGDAVVLDFGAVFEGYCSDMTRTIFMEKADRRLLDLYAIVLEAQLAAINGIRNGMTGRDVDKISRDIITKYGYADCFEHGLGHGVGLDIHEKPKISPASDMAVEEGMVFTIEPGVYVPGLGGIRIEDMVMLENNNVHVLTRSGKDLMVIK